VIGGPTAVLVPLIAQVTLVGGGMGQMPFDGEVHGRLGQLAESRYQAADEGEDEQEPHGR
jgi:hypothetical protein